MNIFRADLHCHTTCSDGSLTPATLVQLAVAQNINALAITDHDTIDAYATALPSAKEAGLQMISGVEFSSFHQGVSVHILAYSFCVDSPDIHSFCAEHQKRREKRMVEMIHLLAKHGMPITEEELYGPRQTKRGIGRPHLAQAMVAKGYIKSIPEAFKHYLGEGKSCYSSGKPNSVEETLDCIRAAKGYAVLAHPHLIDNTGVLKNLLAMPFDGLECHYARFNKQQNQRWVDIASHKNWLILGGSDFHGDIKPAIALGSSWTQEETFNVLRERFRENSEIKET